jgi:hypothetical protein
MARSLVPPAEVLGRKDAAGKTGRNFLLHPLLSTLSSERLIHGNRERLLGRAMGNENSYARFFRAARQGAGLALSRYLTLLPPGPRPTTRRSRLADGLFEFFLLLSRCTAVVGAIMCSSYAKTNGGQRFVLGLLAGWAVGFWIRRSLGMRSWNLTQGFYVRLWERGNGNRPKLLESLVEKLRRDEFTPSQCRMVAGAYAEMQRQLHLCNSRVERLRVFDDLERKVLVTLYGEQAAISHRKTELALRAGNGIGSFLRADAALLGTERKTVKL